MASPLDLKSKLLQAFPGSVVEVEDINGQSNHFSIFVQWAGFAGKGLLEQHQMINQLFAQELKEEIHALQIRTAKP